MTIHRDIEYGERLPVAFVDPIQQFISTLVSENFAITLTNPTTIRVVAGSDNDQVAIGISGKWRYITSTVQRAHPGGAAGTFDVWVVCHDNSYSGAPEEDDTDYSFDLRILTAGSATPATGSGATFAARKVAQLTWDGTAITGVIPLIWGVKLHASTHQPGATDAIDYTLVNLRNTLASRPSAATANAGLYYLATDVQGGTIYQSTGVAWQQAAPGVTGALLPAAHAASHLSGGTDAITWTTVHGYGNLSTRPPASSTNAGYIYFAADILGGTCYRSDGTAWTQITSGVLHGVSHMPGGVDSLNWPVIGSGHFVGEVVTQAGLFAPNFAAEVWGWTDGSAVSRSTYAGLMANIAPSGSGVRTNGSAVITSIGYASGLNGIAVGMAVEGVGIQAGARVQSIDSGSQITLTSTATSSGTSPVQIFPYGNGNGSSTFNLPDTRGRGQVGLAYLGGGHVDVSGIGNADTLAVAFRRPKHRHTNSTALSGSVASTLGVTAGSLAAGVGSLSAGIGSLAVGIGSLVVGKGTLVVDAHNHHIESGTAGGGGSSGIVGETGNGFTVGGTQTDNANTNTISGSPAIGGSPSISGSPALSGSPTLSGAPALSGGISNGSLAVSGLIGVSTNDALDSAPYIVFLMSIRML